MRFELLARFKPLFLAGALVLIGSSTYAEELPQEGPWVNKLTAARRLVPLEEWVASVAQDTGLKLRVSPSVNDRKLNLYLKDLPAYRVLKEAADALDLEWVRDEDTFILSESAKIKTQRNAYLGNRRATIFNALQQQLNLIASVVSRGSNASLNDRYNELNAQFSRLQSEKPAGWEEAMDQIEQQRAAVRLAMNAGPMAQTVYRTLASQPPAFWQSADQGYTLRLPIAPDLLTQVGAENGAIWVRFRPIEAQVWVRAFTTRSGQSTSVDLVALETAADIPTEPLTEAWNQPFPDRPIPTPVDRSVWSDLQTDQDQAGWMKAIADASKMPVIGEALRLPSTARPWQRTPPTKLSDLLASLPAEPFPFDLQLTDGILLMRPKEASYLRQTEPSEVIAKSLEKPGPISFQQFASIADFTKSGTRNRLESGLIGIKGFPRTAWQQIEPLEFWSSLSALERQTASKQEALLASQLASGSRDNYVACLAAPGGSLSGDYQPDPFDLLLSRPSAPTFAFYLESRELEVGDVANQSGGVSVTGTATELEGLAGQMGNKRKIQRYTLYFGEEPRKAKTFAFTFQVSQAK